METLSNSKPKARKDHRCDYCGGVVNKGEIYTWKAHLSCTKLANDLNMFEESSEGVTDADFQEYVAEKYHDLCVEELVEDSAMNFNERLESVKDYFSKNK